MTSDRDKKSSAFDYEAESEGGSLETETVQNEELEDSEDLLLDEELFFDEWDDDMAVTDEDGNADAKGTFSQARDGRQTKGRKAVYNSSPGQRHKRNVRRIGLFVSAVLAVALVGIILVQRVLPTSEQMSGFDYFNVSAESGRVMVILEGEQDNDTGIRLDGRLYLPQSYVADKINVRFYYDRESQAVLYTSPDTTYTFIPELSGYTDTSGAVYQTDVPVIRVVEDIPFIDFEFVASRTNCSYVYGEEPARVVIQFPGEQKDCVTVEKKTEVRYRAGIKSPILEKLSVGEQMEYLRKIDDVWSEVRTDSGFTGYVKTAHLSEAFTVIPEDTYEDAYSSILREHKINMAWFQVTNVSANSYIDSYLAQAQGLNTISPTWYSITSEQGEMSSLVSSDFVSKMKARGIEVWPLVNDFDKDLDYKALYSSKSARTKMIGTLIADAARYGYDGINIDFENIKSEYSHDFLQFIRELSVACQNNNLVLSTDNYKPESYNSCYNLKEQATFVDYVIIMGYDEHYAGSEAGSVASLPFVEEAIADTVEMVPAAQVINAMPFYTRIWTENGSGTTSRAVGMQAAIDDLNANGAVALWDDTVGQYFGSYEKNDSVVKIWFEEDKSIEEKMKLYEKYHLAGVAGWKLGLEKPSVWPVINTYLGKQ